jgi:hypothetical protein
VQDRAAHIDSPAAQAVIQHLDPEEKTCGAVRLLTPILASVSRVDDDADIARAAGLRHAYRPAAKAIIQDMHAEECSVGKRLPLRGPISATVSSVQDRAVIAYGPAAHAIVQNLNRREQGCDPAWLLLPASATIRSGYDNAPSYRPAPQAVIEDLNSPETIFGATRLLLPAPSAVACVQYGAAVAYRPAAQTVVQYPNGPEIAPPEAPSSLPLPAPPTIRGGENGSMLAGRPATLAVRQEEYVTQVCICGRKAKIGICLDWVYQPVEAEWADRLVWIRSGRLPEGSGDARRHEQRREREPRKPKEDESTLAQSPAETHGRASGLICCRFVYKSAQFWPRMVEEARADAT